MADPFGVAEEWVGSDSLLISTPFTMRWRGVEAKLILGNAQQPLDRTLIAGVTIAFSWLDRIKISKRCG